jgi:hypothetical protein
MKKIQWAYIFVGIMGVVIGVAVTRAFFQPDPLVVKPEATTEAKKCPNAIDEHQGVTMTLSIPNTCSAFVMRTEFTSSGTKVSYACADGKVEFKRAFDMDMALNNDPRLNPDMNSVIAFVLKDPSEIKEE